MRKIIQLEVFRGGVTVNNDQLASCLYALCNDGTVWVRDLLPHGSPSYWRESVAIPQPAPVLSNCAPDCEVCKRYSKILAPPEPEPKFECSCYECERERARDMSPDPNQESLDFG